MQLIILTSENNLNLEDITDLGFDCNYSSLNHFYKWTTTIPSNMTVDDFQNLLNEFCNDNIEYNFKREKMIVDLTEND